MNLIFDLTKTQPIIDIKFHGGGIYGEIIFKALIKKTNKIIAYYDSSKWLNPEIIEICNVNNVELIDAQSLTLVDCAKKYNAIVYSPLIEKDIDNIKDITYICTIHGLRTLEYPFDKYINVYQQNKLGKIYTLGKYLKSNNELRLELEKYKRIYSKNNIYTITVSEHSKSSIMSFIPNVCNDAIKVFYSPSIVKEYNTDNNFQDIIKDSENKYYLMVSANRWVKNPLRAMIAFDQLFEEQPTFRGKVVLTGASKIAFSLLKHLKHKNRFIFLDYVDNDKLATLYKNAYALVYPSLNEGFGYPPVEAMTIGTPVIASAISSIPEICGDAVLYFNPLLISEIKMRIIQMEDDEIRNKYIEKGLLRSKIIKEKQDSDLDRAVEFILSFTK